MNSEAAAKGKTMLQNVVMGLSCCLAVLFALMLSATAPVEAQDTGQPENKPALSPELRDTLDNALDHLKRGLDHHNQKMRAIETRLFASDEKILDICRSPMRPTKYRPVLNHFRATKDDPVSLPTIDCMFMKFSDGGARLWTYKPAGDNSYYMLRAHEGMTPNGAFVFAKHPLNFNHRLVLGGSDWVITRSTFSPSDAFPLKADALLTLTEQSDGEDPQTVTAKVVKSFPIVHQVNGRATTVETLHIVVKNLVPKELLGKVRERRRWYVYSQKANVFIERSHALTPQDSKNKAATGVSGDLSALSYVEEGHHVLTLSASDLAALRAYVKDFDVWAFE